MSRITLTVKKDELDRLGNLGHEKQHEACAILIGKKINNEYIVSESIPMENESNSEIRFQVNDDILYNYYRQIEGNSKDSLSIVGIYHTHPSAPIPSETDRAYMRVNPVPWLIKSTITGQMRCFIHDDPDSTVEQVDIIVRD
jgi:proteasome lid subunit RPN8/RPN11